MFSSRVTPDSYHPTLSLRDNLTVCFHLGQHNSSAYTSSLLHLHKNFGYLHGSLTPTQKFRITPRVSDTLTEISDFSTGLLHPHRNSGFLPGSLTPTEIRDTSPGLLHPHRNSGYLPHTEIQDSSPGLLHPHRNSGYLPGSLTPIQKFRISPRVSYTHTEIQDISPGLLHPYRNSGSLPRSLTPTQDLLDTTAGLLHPNSRLLTLGDLRLPPCFAPIHFNFFLQFLIRTMSLHWT